MSKSIINKLKPRGNKNKKNKGDKTKMERLNIKNEININELLNNLAIEKLSNISNLLNYKYGINVVFAKHKETEEFAILFECECCGELDLLRIYTIEELKLNDAEAEVYELRNEYVLSIMD